MTLIKFKQPYRTNGIAGFNNIMDELFENSIQKDFRTWTTPAANIISVENNFELQIAAPGFKRDDFKINIEAERLTVSAVMKETKDDNVIHREYRFGSFNRVFSLPDDIAEEKITATYEDGILRILLPKDSEKSKAREIKIG